MKKNFLRTEGIYINIPKKIMHLVISDIFVLGCYSQQFTAEYELCSSNSSYMHKWFIWKIQRPANCGHAF